MFIRAKIFASHIRLTRKLFCFKGNKVNSPKKESDFCFTSKSILLQEKTQNEEPIIKRNNHLMKMDTADNSVTLIPQQTITIDKEEISKRTNTFFKDVMELSKFKLCVLNTSVALATYAFYASALHTPLDFLLFTGGTLFISMNTQVLNQIIEKLYDKQMKRTQMRPLPKQRISDKTAWSISLVLWSLSTGMYYITCPHAILFSNAILFLYIGAYTPLKRHSNLSMHIGAIVGALPPLLGSFAATGLLNLEESLLLAGYIFAWQYPHFYGILYQNKEDYKRAGFKFISNNDKKIIIAYVQMIVAMFSMLYILYRLNKTKIMNKVMSSVFLVFYAINLYHVFKFISDPTKYSKLIRRKSYTPFMIIICSFIASSIQRRIKLNSEAQDTNKDILN